MNREQLDAMVRRIDDVTAAPSKLPVAPRLGVGEEESAPPVVDFAKPGFGLVSEAEAASWGITFPPRPRDTWLEELGARLDEQDFAAALGDAPAEQHQHIWTTTSPMRCVECRRYLTPWWRRALDRIRRRPR